MVSILTSTIKPQFMNNIFKNYTSQKWKDKELIIILNHDEMDIDKWNKKASHYQNIVIYQLPQKVTLGECLNYGIERSKHDVIANSMMMIFMDPII